MILHNLIVDVEKELGLNSSLDEFEQEYLGQEHNGGLQDEGNENEGPELDDDLATSTGQAFRRQVMNILLDKIT